MVPLRTLVPGFGAPGAPELLIVLLVLLAFGAVVVGVVFALRYLQNRGGRSDRVAELEARVAELEREREEWSSADADADAGVDADADDAAARDATGARGAVDDWEDRDDVGTDDSSRSDAEPRDDDARR